MRTQVTTDLPSGEERLFLTEVLEGSARCGFPSLSPEQARAMVRAFVARLGATRGLEISPQQVGLGFLRFCVATLPGQRPVNCAAQALDRLVARSRLNQFRRVILQSTSMSLQERHYLDAKWPNDVSQPPLTDELIGRRLELQNDELVGVKRRVLERLVVTAYDHFTRQGHSAPSARRSLEDHTASWAREDSCDHASPSVPESSQLSTVR